MAWSWEAVLVVSFLVTKFQTRWKCYVISQVEGTTSVVR